MSIDDPGIPSAPSGGAGVPPAPSSQTNGRPALVDKPRRQARPAADPFDLESALARLAFLLAGDGDTPRANVPRGYYLDILV